MNATECELQKRVVGLIADERGPLLSPAIVSFLSFLTELEPRTCTVYACTLCLRIAFCNVSFKVETFSHISFQREQDV